MKLYRVEPAGRLEPEYHVHHPPSPVLCDLWRKDIKSVSGMLLAVSCLRFEIN